MKPVEYQNILAVDHLEKGYNYISSKGEEVSCPVLENISFQIEPKEFVGIMGRSGCGKKKLLKVLGMIKKKKKGGYDTMKKYDWKNEYNPIRRTAKRLLSGEALTDGRPLSDLIELDEHTRKCLAFEATLTDRQIDMLQELGYLPVIMRQYGEECANCPYTLDEREHGICRRCAVFKK